MSILSDHKKVGKKLISPLNSLGLFYDVNWVSDIIPEIIWVAILNSRLGWKETCMTLTDFARIAMEVNKSNNYVFISSFSKLSEDELNTINTRIRYSGILSKLDYSLFNFIEFYPECPLSFLYKGYEKRELIDVKFITEYKAILSKIYDKKSTESTFLLTSIIYTMLTTGKYNIPKDSILTNLEKIEEYPNSDISHRIAGNLRASINVFFNDQIYDKNVNWIKYFWNKGLSLEPCRI